MNTLERRQIVRSHVIDVSIAKAAINESRRQRADATRKLHTAMIAKHFASTIKSETVSYPHQSAG